MDENEIGLIVLAGFMSILSEKFTSHFDHRIIKLPNFFPLVQDVFKEMKITIPRILNPTDVFYYDKINFDPNDTSHTESITLMQKILSERQISKEKIYFSRLFLRLFIS